MPAVFALGLSALIYWAVTTAAMWKLFCKADRPGWWAIVPLLRLYVLYAIAWETKIFWYAVILVGAVATVTAVQPDMAALYAMLMSLAAAVMIAWLPFRLAKAFGKTVFFGIGLLLLPPVFLLILGFDGSVYTLSAAGSGRRLER